MKAVFVFVLKHYFQSKWGPLFRIIFPIILLLFLGEISVMAPYNLQVSNNTLNPDVIGESLRSATSGVIISSTFIIAFNNFPSSIVVFKESVVLKRISATRISKPQFFVATLLFYLLLAVFNFFYVMLLSGLIISTRLTKISDAWQYVLPIESGAGETAGFFILSILTFLLFGLMIGSVFKKVRTVGMVSGIIQFPTTLLIGGFVSTKLIEKSDILNGIRYLFLHSQPGIGMTSFWRNGTMGETELILAICASFLIMGLCSLVIWKKFKWTD